MLGGGPTVDINGRVGTAEESFSVYFSKAKTKFCLSLNYKGDNSYLFVNGKEIYKLKADNKNVNFPTQISLGIISNGFSTTESREASLKGNMYHFSVNYNAAIDKIFTSIQ